MTTAAGTREIRENASEIKFFIDPHTAARLRERVRTLLSPDPYAGGPNADEYASTTLYFDTADYAVYSRRGSYRRAKYRVRRYGDSDMVFLERKLRTTDFVSKRRTGARIEDLPLLTAPRADPTWVGAWFHERILMRKLEVVCQVTYDRTARIGMTDYGPIRLTLDHNLRGFASDGPEFRSAGSTALTTSDTRSLTDQTIVEMKFRAAMPALFKQIVEEFALKAGRISKYRLAIEATRPDVAATVAARKAAAVAERTANA